jgi:hypothetical protein
MNEIGYALALGLALVFAWAGVAKLRSPRATARSFAALGVPAWFARAVPIAELVLAAALVLTPMAGILALILLALFTIVLTGADDGIACACFGSAANEPVSWVQLLRNVLLMAVAVVASFGERVVPGLAAVLTAVGVAALSLVVLALADLKRRTGHVLALELFPR